MAKQEGFNQSPPYVDVDLFASDQPLKEVVADRVTKIDGVVSEFMKKGQKPAQSLPGLLDKQKDPKIASLLKPLEDRQRTPVAPSEVVVGIPADLLRRRPDVRRAEREVKAQSARIGVATSDFYPRFVILGVIGTEAEHIGDLFSPGSLIGRSHLPSNGPS